MALGTDYTNDVNAPSLITGSYLMPNSLVVAELKPNWVTVEGSDGETVTVTDGAVAAGVGLVGEWVRYSYVLDSTTLNDIAATRLANNIQTVAAQVEIAQDAHWRPWIDYFPGDIIWADLADQGMPAGWYRVEGIAGRFTNEGEGFRYVVSVGRAVVQEDAAVADKVAAILEAGLIDLETGLVTAGETGQASTTVVIQSDSIPAHTHTFDDLPDITLGGDLAGTADNAQVNAIRGYAHSADVAPVEGSTWLWDESNETAVWGGLLIDSLADVDTSGTALNEWTFGSDWSALVATGNPGSSGIANILLATYDTNQWISGGSQSGLDNWITFDFGKEVTMTGFRLVMELGSNMTTDYFRSWDIERSDTGAFAGEEVTVASDTASGVGTYDTTFTATTSRYWKVLCTGTVGNWGRLNQVAFQYQVATTPVDGGVLVWDEPLDQWVPSATAPGGGGGGVTLLPFSITGTLAVGTGTLRFPMMFPGTIADLRVMIGTVPTGTTAIFDVNLNGTTIFTTQGNRPTIAIGANDSGVVTAPDVTTFATGDYFTVDVDQIGSTQAGADAVLVIEVTPD